MPTFAVKEKLTSLMYLLDEQEEPVYDKISESIQAFGANAIPFLEATRENAFDSLVQSRIKTLLHKLNFQNLYVELHNWATLNSNDLLKGYFLISKYLFPDLNEEHIMAQVESLKREVWLELKKNMTPFQEAKVLSKVIFELNKYTLNPSVECFPDSLCINELLENRKGYPIALTVLYAGLAQRLGFPIYGVNMPDSMFLAYVYSGNPHNRNFQNDVLFYINPLSIGSFFTNLEVSEYLAKHYSKDRVETKGACTNPKLILQVAKNMQYAFISSHKTEKVNELSVLMKALDVE
jgi:hypothetical protein